jgi:hypothetical protein
MYSFNALKITEVMHLHLKLEFRFYGGIKDIHKHLRMPRLAIKGSLSEWLSRFMNEGHAQEATELIVVSGPSCIYKFLRST